MPDYPTPRPPSHNFTRNVSIGFVDTNGRTAYGGFSGIDATVTQGEVDALRTAMGEASNAGVFSDKLEDDTEMSPLDAITYDSSYTSVSNVGVLRFDHPDNNYKSRYLEIPAIENDVVGVAGDIDETHALIAPVVSSALAVLNKAFALEDAKYFLGKAYFSDRKGKRARGQQIPTTKNPRP